MNYYIYLIAAVLCFVGETFTMEFSLTCVGLGLCGAAVASYLGLGLWGQLGIFTIVSMFFWLAIRPLALRYLYRNTKAIKTPAQNVIGKQAVVEIEINPTQNTGRVKVEGESWKATSAEALAKGTSCIVEKLDGVTLFVKKIN